MIKTIIPCVIGLGYVGLPVFLRLQVRFKTIGFDNDIIRTKNLSKELIQIKSLKKRINS